MRLVTILKIVAGLVVLVVIAVVIFALTFDANQYKGTIEAQAKQVTGRDLSIKGDLKLTFLPSIGVTVKGVTFSNMRGGSRPLMASIDEFNASVELMPLLSKQIKISSIVLNGADILLETDAQGHPNWEFQPAGPPSPAAAPTSPTGNTNSAGLPLINSVDIKNAKLTYLDGKTKQATVLGLAKASLKVGSGPSPLKIDIAGSYNDLLFTVSGETGSVDALSANQSFPIDLTAKLVDVATVELKGAVKQPTQGRGVDVKFALNVPDLKAVEKITHAPPPATGPLKMEGRLTDPSVNHYALGEMKLSWNGTDLAGSGGLVLGGPRPAISADLTSPKLDLAKLMPPETAAKGGSGVGGGSSSSSAGKSGGRLFSDDPLPLDGLNQADADIKFRTPELDTPKGVLKDVNLQMTLKDGNLAIQPLTFKLADGSVQIEFAIGAKSQAMTAKVDAKGIALGNYLRDSKISDYLNGAPTDMNVDLRGSGKSMHAIMASLSGRSVTLVGEGEIKSEYMELLGADVTRVLSPLQGATAKTKLNCVVTRFDIQGGVATPKPLYLDSGRMVVIGDGNINLGTEQLAMMVTPKPKDAALVSLAIPIRVSGSLSSPSFAPDTAAALKGAAGSLAGSMLLGPAGLLLPLMSSGDGGDQNCASVRAVALGEKPPAQPAGSKPAAPASNTPADAAKNVGNALKGLFGR